MLASFPVRLLIFFLSSLTSLSNLVTFSSIVNTDFSDSFAFPDWENEILLKTNYDNKMPVKNNLFNFNLF